ncbi:MAG: hypothetical protein PHY93_21650 [Bacteriovorax sp.]|nr:hypothetical protein [Bacteriovorax sp.]
MRLNVRKEELPDDLNEVIQEDIKKLPEITSWETYLGEDSNRKGNKKLWKEKNFGGFFQALTSAFFDIVILHVKNGVNEWLQAWIKAKTEQVIDQDDIITNIGGFIVCFRDTMNNVLVKMANEPGAEEIDLFGKKIRPNYQTPFQTSIAKLKAIKGGDRKKDETLAIMLDFAPEIGFSFENLSWQYANCCHSKSRMEDLDAYSWFQVKPEVLQLMAKKIDGRILHQDQLAMILDRKPNLINNHLLYYIKSN